MTVNTDQMQLYPQEHRKRGAEPSLLPGPKDFLKVSNSK